MLFARLGLVVVILTQVAAMLLITTNAAVTLGLLAGATILALLFTLFGRGMWLNALGVAGFSILFAIALAGTTLSTGAGFSPPLPECPGMSGPTRYVQTPFPPILWCAPSVGEGAWVAITPPLEVVVLTLVLLGPLAAQVALVIPRRSRKSP